MSSDAIGWVFKFSPYTGVAFAIHLAIADSCNDQNDDEFWMRQRKLASKARTTRKSVNDILAHMVEDRVLTLLETGNGTNRYRLNMPDDALLVWDKRTPTGAPSDATSRFRVAPVVAGDATSGGTPPATTGDTEPKLEKPKGTQAESAAVAVAPLVSWKVSRAVEEGGHLPAAVELCDLMAKLLRDRGHSTGDSRTKGWVEPMEALLRIDGREPDAVAKVIRWLDRGSDEISAWWRSNVLSPSKLRLRWDQMQEQYKRASGPRPSRTSTALGAGTGPDLADVLGGGKYRAIEGTAR